jgi:hypothetical protein
MITPFLPELFIVALLAKSDGYIRKYADSSYYRHMNNVRSRIYK